jgi:hypothetical protein
MDTVLNNDPAQWGVLQWLDVTAYLAEIGWATIITCRIVYSVYLPRPFVGFVFIVFLSAVYGFFMVTHPWGLIVSLCGWPLYWLFGPRATA